MFSDIYYSKKKSRIHLWEYDKKTGKKEHKTFNWVPYIFVPSNKGDITSLDRKPVAKKTFDTFDDYQKGLKRFENAGIPLYENGVKPVIQFLVDRYHDIPDEEMYIPDLSKTFIDIEVITKPENGEPNFPDPNLAQTEICLITIYNNKLDKYITWGIKKYTGDYDIDYRYFTDEKAMLIDFFKTLGEINSDVITGWNVIKFDITYIINRATYLFGHGNEAIKQFAPLGYISIWENNAGYINIDIPGVTLIDYLDAYKKLAFTKLPNYKLDTVAHYELGEGKIDYSAYHSLRKMYYEDWNLFAEYNVIDVKRVKQLDEKRKLISLIQSLAYQTKTPMKYYENVTTLIEGLFFTYYRRNNMCGAYAQKKKRENFPAALVKDPDKGLHDWVIDLDVTSQYPFMMITMNMGTNTYFGRILTDQPSKRYTGRFIVDHYFTEDDELGPEYLKYRLQEIDVINSTTKQNFKPFYFEKPNGEWVFYDGDNLKKFNLMLKKGYLAIAPNGSVFRTDVVGNIADIEKIMFNKRKQMTALENQARIDGKSKDEIDQYKLNQMAIKTILNSIYGAISTPYFRESNINIAKAITAGGRHTLYMGNEFANEILNNPTEEMNSVLMELRNEKV